MSLFIGNISPRYGLADDLRNVFRKFGRCELKLKSGYGFVVYDFPQDAEKALRELEGRNICGENLLLTWSKKQPIPLRRHQTSVRPYEFQRGRHSARRGDYASRSRNSSNDQRDYKSDIKKPDSDGRRLDSVDKLNEGRCDPEEYVKDDIRRGPLVDGGSDVSKPVDNGRWGGKVDDPSNANGIDKGAEFDRYEPYRGNDWKEDHENHEMIYSGAGSALQRPNENVNLEKASDTTLNRCKYKSKNACFSCGDLGHKIRDCPRKHLYGRKPSRFDNRQDDAIDKIRRGEVERERFGSKSYENLRLAKDTASRHINYKRASDAGKNQRLIGNGRSPVTVCKETERTEIKDRGRKKRSRGEGESPKRYSAKKARPSRHSDDPASKSCAASLSSKSVSRSGFQGRSRSVSVGAHSLSSDSRSVSSSKSMSSVSRSRSSSFSSLSNSLKPKELLHDKEQPIEGEAHIETDNHEVTVNGVNKAHAGLGVEVEDEMKNDQPLKTGGDDNHITSMSIDQEVTPSTPPSYLGVHDDRSPSPEGLKNKLDPQNSGALVIRPTQSKEPASETPAKYCTDGSTCISSEEMRMVMKHYGMELPEDCEKHLPIEGYFGSARLWPWEIIYYRRLRKGLISVENYARRVAQNQEFGIIDKYIRSSSGWGEIDHEIQ